jgi:hypothetical protein
MSNTSSPEWTWSYRKIISHTSRSAHQNEVSFTQTEIPHFLQLIFSWNAKRPHKGYFQFWIKVRDAKTKEWSEAFKMSEWGVDRQNSFHTKGADGLEFVYVRLETKSKGSSDGFSLRAVAHEGARLSDLKALMVNTSDSLKFHSEIGSHALASVVSAHVKNVPSVSQFELDHPRKDGLCSPTSCSMLMSYFLKKVVDPLDFAEQSYDRGLEKYGSWPFNMAHAFECGKGAWWFAVVRLNSFAHLCKYLHAGVPVAVSVRGPLAGAHGQYAQGHLLVVTGYDAPSQEVICNDPAAKTKQAVVTRYKLPDFLAAWERSQRLAYVAERVKRDNSL